MTLRISWTRTALKLPTDVRRELARRLETVSAYFPEMKQDITIGITRSYDGLAFQSDEGSVKLMLDVRRRKGGGWKYPTYWTMAHELMHLAQFNSKEIPGGERACDIYALSRLPPKLIDDSPSYLVVPRGLRSTWTRRHAQIAHRTAREAVARRATGLRRYASWWERAFEERVRSTRTVSKRR